MPTIVGDKIWETGSPNKTSDVILSLKGLPKLTQKSRNNCIPVWNVWWQIQTRSLWTQREKLLSSPRAGEGNAELLSLWGFRRAFSEISQKLISCCSIAKSCLTLREPMDSSPVLHYLPEFAQIHVHWVGNAIRPSHPLLPPSPFTLNLSQHQGLFQWVGCSHQMTKILELQL